MDAQDLDDVLLNADDKMAKCVEHLHTQFSALRTGKASSTGTCRTVCRTS